jgi:hypothetical protein
MAPIDKGIASPSRRHVVIHRRHPSGRSIFNPAPINATITTNSVKCSVHTAFSKGFIRGSGEMGDHANKIPMPMQQMGNDRGMRRRTSGSHAVRSTMAPNRNSVTA